MRAGRRTLMALAFAATAACQLLAGIERADKEEPGSPPATPLPDGGVDADAEACPVTVRLAFDDLDAATPGDFGFDAKLGTLASEAGLDEVTYQSPPHGLRIAGDGTSDVNAGFLLRTRAPLLGTRLRVHLRFREDTDAGPSRQYLLAAATDTDPTSAGEAAALGIGLRDGRLVAGVLESIRDPQVRRAFDAGISMGELANPEDRWIELIVRLEDRCPDGDGGGLAALFFVNQEVLSSGCLPIGTSLRPDAEGAVVLGLRSTDDGAPATVWYDDVEIRSCAPGAGR